MQLANGSAIGFLTPEIERSAELLVSSLNKMKTALTAKAEHMSSPLVIQKGMASFEELLVITMASRPDCVKEEMRNAAPNAVAEFQHCQMDPAEVKTRIEQGEKKLQDLLTKIRQMDTEVATKVTDPVVKAQKIAEVDIDLMGGFFMDVIHDITNNMGPVMACTEKAATNLREKLLSYIDDVGKCYA